MFHRNWVCFAFLFFFSFACSVASTDCLPADITCRPEFLLRLSPAAPGPIQSVAEGAADHTCILLKSGRVRCFGLGLNGRLGYGNVNDIGDNELARTTGDVNVGGLVKQIAVGLEHTCALLEGGNVRCWGKGLNGRLGYGNTNDIGDDETPASAGDVNIAGTVTQLSAGRMHTCALLSTGNVRCWGAGTSGRLGYVNANTIGDDETPASAGDVNVGGTVIQITSGAFFNCALLAAGNVRCWGAAGADGRLGYANANDIGDNETPASAGDVSIGGTVVQLSSGEFHTCAVLSTGQLQCWGNGTGARTGHGNTNHVGDDELPSAVPVVDIGGTVTQTSAGQSHSCARMDTGRVRCFGFGDRGRLGYGSVTSVFTPSVAGDVDTGDTVVQVTAAVLHTCAVLASGYLRCWGVPDNGRLGYGNTDVIGDNEKPASVPFVPVADD